MEVYLKNRMRTTSIFFHPSIIREGYENLLKPSPKGEGFDPPRGRQ
jgi:hypothetical protein